MSIVFIFLYNDMNPGGIQNNMYNISKHILEKKGKVIWICTNKYKEVFSGYRDVINECNIQILYINEVLNSEILDFDENDDIRALCFSPISYRFLDKLKQKYKKYPISTYYIMPHFENRDYFPDRFLPIALRGVVKKQVRALFKSLDSVHSVLFFDKVHYQSFSEYYCLNVRNLEEKLAKNSKALPEVDYNDLINRTRRETFRILSVCRFEFPHKGYVIGLINQFSDLRLRHNKLHLDIVGSGDEIKYVEDVIARLNPIVKESIFLHGYKSPEELMDFFKNANLNIGVGGALLEGARYGIPSLPARHYSLTGEVYGFLPDSHEYLLSDKPGEKLDKLVEELLSMTDDSYLSLCQKSRDIDLVRGKVSNPLWLFEVPQNCNVFLNKKQRNLLELLNISMKLVVNFERLLMLFSNPSIFIEKTRKYIGIKSKI